MPKTLNIRRPTGNVPLQRISVQCEICKSRRAFNKSFYTDKPTCEKCHKIVKSELLKKFKRLCREDKVFRKNFFEHFNTCKNPKCNNLYCYLVLGIWKKIKRRKLKPKAETRSEETSTDLLAFEADTRSEETSTDLLARFANVKLAEQS